MFNYSDLMRRSLFLSGMQVLPEKDLPRKISILRLLLANVSTNGFLDLESLLKGKLLQGEGVSFLFNGMFLPGGVCSHRCHGKADNRIRLAYLQPDVSTVGKERPYSCETCELVGVD